MKQTLLGRPKWLLVLVALELVLVAPIGAMVRALLGRGGERTLQHAQLAALDAQAWAELLFIDRAAFGALLVPLLLALVVWWAISAVLPATFVSALVRQEDDIGVAVDTAKFAPSLWQLSLRGMFVRVVLFAPAAVIGAVLARGATSYATIHRALVVGGIVTLLGAALATAWLDLARVHLLDELEPRPIARALATLRQRPLVFVAIAFAYGAAWLVVVAGYTMLLPLFAATAVRSWVWQGLFVTARLLIASGRIVGLQAGLYASLTDSK